MSDKQVSRAGGVHKELQQPEVDLHELLTTAEDAQHKVSASSPRWRKSLVGASFLAILYSRLIGTPWLSIAVLFFFLAIFRASSVYSYRTRGVRHAVRGSGKPMQQNWFYDVPPGQRKRMQAGYMVLVLSPLLVSAARDFSIVAGATLATLLSGVAIFWFAKYSEAML
ncbi:hypothetical protein [Corynebacterium silvaticum]|uniref:Uncharacterized protein n=1 Tax=Corynebacterium silvaticum TaxID=2320431 RepID=A0ACD4PZ34_9CORY|nr:hypothetical protein [Corynebacterium silvaticum]WCV10782.1 hypothetical protein CBE74_05295 [Corynebacterium silvaticum]